MVWVWTVAQEDSQAVTVGVGREVTLHPQDMKQPPKRKGGAKAGRLKHNLRVPSRAELQRRMSGSGDAD